MKLHYLCAVSVILMVVLISGCVTEQPIGGDTDEHGCLIAAGYSWCQNKEKCLRVWEEPCVTSFEECVTEGNPVMESYPRQCSTPEGETFTEDTGGEAGLANPASVYCLEQGGTTVFHETAEGTAGYCEIAVGVLCEEWEYFRSNGTVCNGIE
ncbi:MAG: DUF333 domain-containing protein [Candidatus Aenigmarchaeota archaeon]|nr:DUF333 domain-containing protein [Candidatus Aenigmarchaeota archaeon]